MNDNKIKINTKTLPGFIEYLPEQQIAFDKIKDTVRRVYEAYGFVPLDTPVLERRDVILAKAGGETEKQIYYLQKGDEDLALRFDLTVPLARYVSEHYAELAFPFRRYQIAKVYRGERAQRGRFREFYQADIDIVAENELPLTSDAEIVSIINRVFTELDLGSFTVRLNNRKLLSGFLASLDLADQITTVLRLIDKLDKIGRDGVREELLAAGIDGQKTDQILDFVSLSGDVLAQLAALSVDDETFRTGLAELTAVVSYLEDFGVPAKNYQIDLSIARGLDYYTGTVYETVLNDYPQIGSVCSGGRYNDLAGYYTNRCFPGVGVSIGLTRLFYQLEAAGLVKTERRTTADILLLSEDLAAANRLAEELRNSGLAVIGAYGPEKFKKKLAFANKLGVAGVVILGGDELAGGYYSVKNMISGEQIKARDLVEIKKFINVK